VLQIIVFENKEKLRGDCRKNSFLKIKSDAAQKIFIFKNKELLLCKKDSFLKIKIRLRNSF
jgi:hypothetical protein